MVGFEGGTLTIVAGRPSMGKSQISLQLALKMILLHDLPVAIFSLEMTKKQLEYRLWSLISVTNAYKHLGLTPLKNDRIRRHRAKFQPLADWEFTFIAKIVDIASELPLYMNDSRGITVSQIASECRQIKAKEGKLGLGRVFKLVISYKKRRSLAINAYKKRFDIEEMFRYFKSCGYKLEDTNVSGNRLISLILIISFAYSMSTFQGQKIKRIGVQKYIARVKDMDE